MDMIFIVIHFLIRNYKLAVQQFHVKIQDTAVILYNNH